MSGAEAIAVLGIISSVIAIVDGTKQIYDAASNAAGLPEAFREVSGRLPIVRGVLQSAEQHIRDSSKDDRSCLAMRPLIDACEKRAKNLETIFQKVIPVDDVSRLERYFRAARILGKGGRVETLMEGLMKDVLLIISEHGMETATSRQVSELENAIKDLAATEPSIPDIAFEESAFTNNNFGNGQMMNNNVVGTQKFQANYGTGKQFQAESQTFHMDEMTDRVLIAVMPDESRQICEESECHIPWRTCCLTTAGILDQLEFQRMNERYEDIVKAHFQTFQWIYERPELKFVHWLESGNGVFWITGKPGSGKSTLMKFIYQDQRTANHMPQDVKNRLIARFFFNDKGGDQLLKSQEGLFRAILHTILMKFRQLIPIALPKRYKRWKRNPGLDKYNSSTPKWSIKELRAGFKAIVSQSQMPLHLCLLIDGLDEFSGPYKDIIKTLAELIPTEDNCQVRVQLCLSSRPLGAFEKAYLQHTHLRVQDLTAGDIKLYVNTKFREDAQLADLLAEDPTTTNLMIEEILQKAEGVFLWVNLVVHSLIESLDNGDDMKILQKRLSVLPAGLAPLYKSMIGQIQSFYREESGKVFQMVHFAILPLSPLAMSFAGENPQHATTHDRTLSDSEIAKRHSDLAKQLRARTACLIEMSPVRNHGRSMAYDVESNEELEDEQVPWKQSQLQYMHLTVKEFLLNEDIPRWLADKISISAAGDAHLSIAACCLFQLRGTNSLDLYDYRANEDRPPRLITYTQTMKSGIVFMILFHMRQADRTTRASKLVYLESLNEFLSTLSRGQIQFRWFLCRFGDWCEPAEWLTDFVSYLVTIGMTYSVIDAINNHGYDPAAKVGRPLLSYATCNYTPSFELGPLERDTIDPVIVEVLLELRMDPNQSFMPRMSGRSHNLSFASRRTVWEEALMSVAERFSEDWPRTEELDQYNEDLQKDAVAVHDLRRRWLTTIELLLVYGAYSKQADRWYRNDRGKDQNVVYLGGTDPPKFDEVFDNCDNSMVSSVRRLMRKTHRGSVKSRISSTIRASHCNQS